MMPGSLLCGAATGAITPMGSRALAGYAARGDAVSEGTLDELEAAVLILDDGETVVVWVTLDALAVTSSLSSAITRVVQNSVGSAASVLVAASHTHSGPAHWLGEFAPGHRSEYDDDAVVELLGRVERLAVEAWSRRAPSEASWLEPRISSLASRRAYPDSTVDISAGTLAVTTAGRMTAMLVDVPCHATVLGPDSLKWSADWPGGLRRAVRREHPDAVVAFLNGASGDLSTRFTRRDSTFAEAERLGELVADAVLAGLDDAEPVAPRLLAREVTLTPEFVRRDRDAAAARLAVAEAHRAAATGGDAAVLQSVVDGARGELAVAESELPDPQRVTAHLICLGHVTWVALPFEVFSSTAAALADSARAIRTIGCVGDYLGYLPDARAIADDTYEARTARVSATAEPRVRGQLAVALTLLDHIHPHLESE